MRKRWIYPRLLKAGYPRQSNIKVLKKSASLQSMANDFSIKGAGVKKAVTGIMAALIFLTSPCLAEPVLTVGCQEIVTCYRESVSRDTTCLEFADKGTSCTIQGMVGGEHISHVRVSAPASCEFLIQFSPVMGNPGFSLSGEGISWEKTIPGQTRVFLHDAGVFTISLSAHPHGEYLLVIEKQHPGNPLK